MSTANLFKPLKLGKVELQNRLVLAPLTRYRADDANLHLLLNPLKPISTTYSALPAENRQKKEQIASWKKVTEAVHAKGSFIYL
ncbi:Aldolase-type TIM barrel protein [Rutstroemia sp. NJR-2017a BBW]|nr:Aldolase-type TIM barrel protein [Rutstroemia sp. NJR-2017a BBW]